MNDVLLRLRDKGNTVLVVEHEPETIAIADHVVDLGPGAGTAGGTVCFEGTIEGLRTSDTITGRHLDDRAALKETVRTPTGALEIRGATAHNLRDVDVDIPLGVLVVVTGVAGSGKSSLVHGSLSCLSGPAGAGVVSIDQGAIRGSRRSNPATYTGLLDPIRKAFAKANGVKPALFSANSEGACPSCNGAGVIYTDLAMMAGVATTCEECEGKRFDASVLDHHVGGRDISEVLAMSVTEAEEFFGAGEARTPAAHAILDRLADVGLGYLSLGQPLPTLSGGERQRLKLATHLAEKGGVYVLDEPTSGLHLADVEQLLGLLDRPRRRPDRLRGHTRRPRRRPLHPHRRAPRGLRRHKRLRREERELALAPEPIELVRGAGGAAYLTEALADTVRRVLSSVSTRPTRDHIHAVMRPVGWSQPIGRAEGQSTIGFGVRARLPFRVFVLQGPGAGSRFVIDVAHRW
jgi:excinuclease UvrABC ATPase subunit